MQPHYSQSSREIATPSSGTSPLASYKKVTPPGTFHLQCKHSGTFANRLLKVSCPKNPKMYDPILVTLWKMRPHYIQFSRENGTPYSGTSPLASYKEVPTGGL